MKNVNLKNFKVTKKLVVTVIAGVVGCVMLGNAIHMSNLLSELPSIEEPAVISLEQEDTALASTPQSSSTKKTTTKKSVKSEKMTTAATKNQTVVLSTEKKPTKTSVVSDTSTTTVTEATDVTVKKVAKYTKGSKTRKVTTTTTTTVTTTTTTKAATPTPAPAAPVATAVNTASTTISSSSPSASTYTARTMAPKFPSNILDAFDELGFKVIVDPNYTQASGYFNAKTQTLTLNKGTGTDIYHELGHFLAFAAGNVDKSTAFQSIYESEKSKYQGTYSMYASQNASEFFAECCREYCLNGNALKGWCPKTYEAISNAIDKVTPATIKTYKSKYASVWAANK